LEAVVCAEVSWSVAPVFEWTSEVPLSYSAEVSERMNTDVSSVLTCESWFAALVVNWAWVSAQVSAATLMSSDASVTHGVASVVRFAAVVSDWADEVDLMSEALVTVLHTCVSHACTCPVWFATFLSDSTSWDSDNSSLAWRLPWNTTESMGLASHSLLATSASLWTWVFAPETAVALLLVMYTLEAHGLARVLRLAALVTNGTGKVR